ncbi:unnamed protein product [Brassicogethes aeneus]|uniref:Yippee domain-containing protein n=1 Tax=Brassicogethes aeneus TaxID=1431903 RepID=A0A9P0FPS2_BRAAE|nr:unnamed protein product [Brassicogethes aeneus]
MACLSSKRTLICESNGSFEQDACRVAKSAGKRRTFLERLAVSRRRLPSAGRREATKNGENFSGLFAASMPSDLLLHTLPRSSRQSRRAHFQGNVICRILEKKNRPANNKSFQGSQGRAYLFNSVVNVGCGPAEERVLLTGLHAVADIYCECCKTTLGWKYEHAFESSQKYKEGKFIIELAHMIKENGWD